MLKHGSIVTKVQMVSNKTTGQDNSNEEIKWILKSYSRFLNSQSLKGAQRKGS